MAPDNAGNANHQTVQNGTICTALNVSDEKQCQENATSVNRLFCYFHSKQCQDLYKGYKTRNARLDALNAKPPYSLATASVPLANQTFGDVDSEDTLDELHRHLFLKYSLLDRVIRARKLHHSRFFFLKLDYGHQNYLDNLQSQKFIVLRALERLERRTAEVLYKQEKWFSWVRQCQDEEEAHREKEIKRVKRESALVKRHWKELKLRMNDLRSKEDARRQENYLDEVYRARMSESKQEEEANWDPIEEVIENERGNFLDLIRHFLWRDALREDSKQNSESNNARGPSQPEKSDTTDATSVKLGANATLKTNGSPRADGTINGQDSFDKISSVTTKGSKSAKNKKKSQGPSNAIQEPIEKGTIESRSEMRQRLQQGSEYKYEHRPAALLIQGSIENPVITSKTAALPDDEIDQLLKDIFEIKHLLFCRLLLSHAALLPAALRAQSIEDFLNDEDISDADLRDICLKMEQPGLEEIRDACADLMRNGQESTEDDDGELQDDDEELDIKDKKKQDQFAFRKRAGALPESWSSKQERKLRKRREAGETIRESILTEQTVIDFGVIDDGQYTKKNIRVKICGKLIYNYPSEKAMTRGGWLHFSIIAKDSNLYDAIQLCRHWDEFFELNILSIFHYFPAANWLSWVGDRTRSQFLQLGFIPYLEFSDAEKMTVHHQSARNVGRRTHAIYEARNFICAHIQRNNAISRRFIQYLAMQTSSLCLLVRDAKTSRILIKPPQDELWLVREKSGIGRASNKEWNVVKKVGPDFFKEIDSHRKWHFGFSEYYDVYVWDLEAGEQYYRLYNAVQDTLIKANRFCSGADFYNPAAPILKTLIRDPGSHRVRDIRPDKDTDDIYTEIHDEKRTWFVHTDSIAKQHNDPPIHLLYKEADLLEDQILFPDELQDGPSKASVREITNSMRKLEHGLPNMRRFVLDLDTDEETDEEVDEGYLKKIKESRYRSDEESEEGSDEESSEEVDEESDSTDPDEVHEHSEEEEELTEEQLQLQNLVEDWFSKTPYEAPDMRQQFDEWLDREKANIFKECWHKADLEPGAQEKYKQMTDLVERMTEFDSSTPARKIFRAKILAWLKVHPMSSRRVFKDIRKAASTVGLFFPLGFYEFEAGLEFKESLLVNQKERAKNLPDRRTQMSNDRMPAEMWKEWDALPRNGHIKDDLPVEWDNVMRPIVAHLFKEGILCNAYTPSAAGQGIVAAEPGRPKDLYIDYRAKGLTDKCMPPALQNPHQPTTSLLAQTRQFARQNPNARFALLRIWSAPHFYPLMLGLEKRDELSFFDKLGRCWAWKFIPKDMPCSEWSMHHQSRLRLEPFPMLREGANVLVRRDLFLVMGLNEGDLREVATAVAFAILTRPWRWEVDVWRSFVNVDLEFLEGLDGRWFD